MPVRVRIHSSLVSTIFSRSALVMTRGGRNPATPVIFAAMRCDMTLLAGNWRLKTILNAGFASIGHETRKGSLCDAARSAQGEQTEAFGHPPIALTGHGNLRLQVV